MQCPECKRPARCTDTREKLSYAPDIKKGEEKPLRERKYVCGPCNRVYITREYLFKATEVKHIKDKRITDKTE